MLRPFRLPALAALLVMAGCGSSADAPHESKDTAARPAAAGTGGPMKVAPVDGRVGDATAATSANGVQRLKARRRATDPDAVREGVGAGASCADVDLAPAGDNLPAVAAATLCLVNGERADAGLPPLGANAKLDRSSLAHAQDMVASGYFAHESQDGRSVVDRTRAAGYIDDEASWSVGENLAWGTGTLATPKAIVQSWMGSQGHRENILRSGFEEAGLGIALGTPRPSGDDGQGATYTMNFGSTSGGAAQTVASTLTSGVSAPGTKAAAPRAATRRAVARRRKACRARATKARASSVRKARLRRCARAGRRASRR